jgi:hypothetical protein
VAVDDVLESVSVVLQVAVQLAGENVAVTPAGTPEATKVTEGAAPDVSVTVMELVVVSPAAIETAGGFAVKVKEVTGAVIVNATVVEAVAPAPVPVTTML